MKRNKVIDIVRDYCGEKPVKIEEITAEGPEPGRGSFLVYLNNKKIKVIMFDNKTELANFLLYSPKVKRTPRILFHKSNMVIVEWLEGQILNSEQITEGDIQNIAKLQAGIHKAHIKIDRTEVLGQWKKSVAKWLALIKDNKLLSREDIEKIEGLLEGLLSKKIRLSLIHSDFNLDNLIRTKRGWFSIDNELLQVGITGYDFGKPVINWLKSDERIKVYLDAYDKVSSVDFYRKDEHLYQLLFLIKMIVSRFRKKQSLERYQQRAKDIIRKVVGR
jgi:thiamine kinase-like enzyme